jgi:hypothetical protein
MEDNRNLNNSVSEKWTTADETVLGSLITNYRRANREWQQTSQGIIEMQEAFKANFPRHTPRSLNAKIRHLLGLSNVGNPGRKPAAITRAPISVTNAPNPQPPANDNRSPVLSAEPVLSIEEPIQRRTRRILQEYDDDILEESRKRTANLIVPTSPIALPAKKARSSLTDASMSFWYPRMAVYHDYLFLTLNKIKGAVLDIKIPEESDAVVISITYQPIAIRELGNIGVYYPDQSVWKETARSITVPLPVKVKQVPAEEKECPLEDLIVFALQVERVEEAQPNFLAVKKQM